MDRGWRELVDGEEMKLRVGVLQGLELGFLGVFCSAAATAIDCHIDRQSNAEIFFCFSSVNVTFACLDRTCLLLFTRSSQRQLTWLLEGYSAKASCRCSR